MESNTRTPVIPKDESPSDMTSSPTSQPKHVPVIGRTQHKTTLSQLLSEKINASQTTIFTPTDASSSKSPNPTNTSVASSNASSNASLTPNIPSTTIGDSNATSNVTTNATANATTNATSNATSNATTNATTNATANATINAAAVDANTNVNPSALDISSIFSTGTTSRRDRRAATPSAPQRKLWRDEGGFWQAQFSNFFKLGGSNTNEKSPNEQQQPSSTATATTTSPESEAQGFVHVEAADAVSQSPVTPPMSIPEKSSDTTNPSSQLKRSGALDRLGAQADGSPTKSGSTKSLSRSKSESAHGGLKKVKPQGDSNKESAQTVVSPTKNASPHTPPSAQADATQQQTQPQASQQSEPKARERSNSIIPTKIIDETRFITRRDKIVLEIYKTECTYVASLDNLLKIFYGPLKEYALNPKQDIITPKDVFDIFSNAETIHAFNSKFRDSVEERLRDWTTDQRLADVFLKMAPFLRMYTQYVNNYDQAMSILKRLTEKHESFRNLIRSYEQSPHCCGLTMHSFLIMPIQRVPRYVLLLQDLQRNTDESHPDYENIKNAFIMIKDIADQINEKIREDENARKFFSIQHRLVGFDHLIQPHRRFLGEFKMTVGPRPTRVVTDFFLFNDILVSATSMNSFLHCEHVFPFNVLWINDPYPDQLFFEIISPERKISLCSQTVDEKKQNYAKIHNALKDHLEKTNRQIDGIREGEFSTLTFGIYVGEWMNAKMHGKGRMTYINGNFYQGEWEYGKRKGQGRFIISTPDNVILEGQWEDDKLNGEGTLSTSTGMKYIGQWVNGQRHGKGKIIFPDESVLYDGSFQNGNFDGEGFLQLKQGSYYKGNFKLGLRHGQGEMKNEEGKYIGDWVNDRKDGNGRLEYPNGDVYEGPFKDDLPNGRGVYKFLGGNEYSGQFQNGRMEGDGKIQYPNGDLYTGDIRDGRRHGFGRLVRADKAFYLGQWVNDKREGKGKHVYANGDSYEGNWKEDRKNGAGAFKWANGGSFTGNWVNDKKEGKGVLRFRLSPTPGDLFDWEYDGNFKDDKMHGQGTLVFPNSSRYEGAFVNDVRDGKGVYYPRFGESVTQFWTKGSLIRSSNSIVLTELENLHRFC